jgi:hypothetical protein
MINIDKFGGGTLVEHLPYHHKVEGSVPPAEVDTGRELNAY